MKRREWLKSCTALALAAGVRPGKAELSHLPYTRDLYEESLESGKPFLLDFYASW